MKKYCGFHPVAHMYDHAFGRILYILPANLNPKVLGLTCSTTVTNLYLHPSDSFDTSAADET